MSENAVEKPFVSEARVRVRYAETDQMGVVYHANYLVWFEVGRVEFIRKLGMDYRSMELEDGIGIAVVNVSARYKYPARYDDELVIETRLLAARGFGGVGGVVKSFAEAVEDVFARFGGQAAGVELRLRSVGDHVDFRSGAQHRR